VHWPSDVLAGWSLGAAWAVAVYAISRQLHHYSQTQHHEAKG
jgi:undecaprenyl-diphosphatase